MGVTWFCTLSWFLDVRWYQISWCDTCIPMCVWYCLSVEAPFEWVKKFVCEAYTGCPNKMLTLFDMQFLQLLKRKGTWHFTGCLEQNLIFIWLKSTIPIKSYEGKKIEFEIVLGLISHLKCTQQWFGLIFYGVITKDRTKQFSMVNFLIEIIITFDRSGRFWSKKHHFKA